MKKILLFLLVCACGFRPIFSGDKTDIYVPVINGINGIELRNALNAKFGGQRTSDAPYTLTVSLQNPQTQYKALDRSGAASWQSIKLTANYTLKYKDKQIASGSESASESYTFVSYLVAANASYNNAVSNTISVLADKISTKTIAEIYKYESEQQPK